MALSHYATATGFGSGTRSSPTCNDRLMLRASQATWKTDTGRQRKDNEDNAFARPPLFVVANPSAAINNTRARWTSRYGAVCERNSFSRTDRCSSLTASGDVGKIGRAH